MELKEEDQVTPAAFLNLSLGETPSKHTSSCSLNLEESIDLKESIEILFRDATGCADLWKDVNIKFDDRRSFPAFLQLLQFSGLDWHKYGVSSEDNELNVTNQPNRSSLGESSYRNLTSNSNWVMGNRYYGRSLSLMELLQRIQSESRDDFSQEQAGLLASFLNHLVEIQQEHLVVAYGFAEHLERLRKRVAVSRHTNSSNADADDGHANKFIKHPIYMCMRKHKHLFDSLYIMSRESIWLLSKLEASHSRSPSFVEESHQILETILLFISEFKKSKESLDHYLFDGCCPFVQDELMTLVLQNERLLEDFAKRIKDLQEQGVGRKTVAETLLGCFVYVVNKVDYYYQTKQSPSGDTYTSLQGPFSEAAKETSVLIKETIEKLNSVRCSSLSGGGSPLGNITLWRILFESSLVNLQLDSICKKHAETIKLRVRLLDSVMNPHLDQLNASIQQLLTVGENILEEFVAMHKTVAEITYMLGDAFTTGGAGMNDLMSDETSPRTSNKNDKEM